MKLFWQNTINQKDIIIFFRQFATLLTAGVPIIRSCDLLSSSQEKMALNKLIKGIRTQLVNGKPLSICLRLYQQYFDELTYQLIYIGEQTGKIDDMLYVVADYHEKNFILNRKIKQIIFYPFITMLITFWIVYALMIFVIPHFSELFKENYANLPLITLIIFDLANTFQSGITFLFLFFHVIGIILLIYSPYRKKIKKKILQLFIVLPFINRYFLKVIHARFARQLALTFSAGLPITDALTLTVTLSSQLKFATVITLLRNKLNSGLTLHLAMQSLAYFPELMIQMVKIGEETGKLDFMLNKTAEFIETDIDHFITQASKIIEPLIMLFLGVLIGLIVIGMYLPIFKLGTAF